MIDKYSSRIPLHEQIPKLAGPTEARFNTFECFPKIASKYSSKIGKVPLFKNYSSRSNAVKEKRDADDAQVIVNANKEYPLRSLTLGMINFDQ